MKSAALHRRQNAHKLAALERQQLLGTPEAAAKRKQMATVADVIGVSEGITESLRRTRQIMSEVRRFMYIPLLYIGDNVSRIIRALLAAFL